MNEPPILGVIGGSGLYHFNGLQDQSSMEIDTPFGMPSSPVMTGTINGKKIAFLARHGIGHFINPSEVNYRANIYALKSLGIRQVIGISACGSLRLDYKPGEFVIPDQIIDFTRNRARTFFENGLVVHISSAEPFCPDLSAALWEAANATETITHKGGTTITIEGPRFSTKAESHLFRSWGISAIGMTTSTEAFLAREAELCYASLAHITDYDVWHVNEDPVTVEMVVRTLNANTEAAQKTIINLLAKLDVQRDCDCQHSLEKAIITHSDHINPAALKKLDLLVGRYLAS
jgi:5'-methylthioadenosine phosphorylase